MSNDVALLARLRAVFRGELEDHLATIERTCLVLARPEEAPARLQEAVQEIFRAAHSLKGAARAVDHAQVEHLCHELESILAPVRAGSVALDPEWVRARTEAITTALHAWARAHAAEPHASSNAGETTGPESIGPAAANPAPGTEPPGNQDRLVPASGETVRVTTARIGELLGMGEELVSFLAGTGHSPAAFATLDDSTDDLRRHLGNLRRLVRTLPGTHDRTVAMAALDSAITVVQTIAMWSLHRRRAQSSLWRGSMRRARRMAAAARRLRMVPFGPIQTVLERAALETARTVGKQVMLTLHGGEMEVDRQILERLSDPLSHLVRNAVDHGIEPTDVRQARGKQATGQIEVTVRAAGEEVVVTVADDGAGIDLAAVRAVARQRGMELPPEAADSETAHGNLTALLFEPGFTTRATATAISGRGVGLDVVRQRVAAMQGRIAVRTVPGQGTRFELVLPLDLSAMSALVLEVRGAVFALAETAVVRLVRAMLRDVQVLEGCAYLRQTDGALIPMADLRELLGHGLRTDTGPSSSPRQVRGSGPRLCVIMAAGERRVALVVDGLRPSQMVVIKPLGRRVRRAAFVAGATVLQDGEVAPVLDVLALVARARPAAMGAGTERPARPPARILVADDSVTTRQLLRSLLEAAGYHVRVATDGQSAWSTLIREPVDLVVSDIEMPRMDGFQLLARVRASATTARIPVVLVTALSRDADRQRALDLGASAYVVKGSFDQEALLDIIEELLG